MEGFPVRRVILADDQWEVRSAMRLILEENPGFSIAGEVSTAHELLKQIQPDIDLVLMDWELPGIESRDLVPLLKEIYPNLKLIALSSSPQARQSALEAGVYEFVCKADPPESLIRVIKNYYCDSNR